MHISAVVAMSENGCIGKDNELPWYIPEDLKRFKALTLGKPVIMGRKTFESIYNRLGKPLPGRTNIVISRSDFVAPEDKTGTHSPVIACKTIEDALAAAHNIVEDSDIDDIIIGGGAQIYELAMPYTSRVFLTEVHAVVNGDAFLPVFNKEEWTETANDLHEGDPSYSFRTLERR